MPYGSAGLAEEALAALATKSEEVESLRALVDLDAGTAGDARAAALESHLAERDGQARLSPLFRSLHAEIST